MIESFRTFRRNYGHWDIVGQDGRLFRIRGGPSHWTVFDERKSDDRREATMIFKEQSAAMSYICAELMHEILMVEGHQPHAIESWNIPHQPIEPFVQP